MKKLQISSQELGMYGAGLIVAFSLTGLVLVNTVTSIESVWDALPIIFSGVSIGVGIVMVVIGLFLSAREREDKE